MEDILYLFLKMIGIRLTIATAFPLENIMAIVYYENGITNANKPLLIVLSIVQILVIIGSTSYLLDREKRNIVIDILMVLTVCALSVVMAILLKNDETIFQVFQAFTCLFFIWKVVRVRILKFEKWKDENIKKTEE